MRRAIATVLLLSAATLSGCAAVPAVDAGDKEACEIWAKAEQDMMTTVSVIANLTADVDPQQITEEFNTRRNELLVAYQSAAQAATNADLKSLLEKGLDEDASVYFAVASSTAEDMAASAAAVAAITASCVTAGIDVGKFLGND